MDKSSLIDWQGAAVLADPTEVVERAASTAAKLTQMRSRGPGDLDNAMRSVSQEYGVSYSVLWALRYRRNRVKDLATSIFVRLHAAYDAECAKQVRKLEHEVYVARRVGTAEPDLREAETVVAVAREARGVHRPVRRARRVGVR